MFIDNIPEGTIFIEDSLSINNVIQPGVNPENGITLSTIQPNETVTISFQVQLTNIPEGNTVTNISDTSYEYQIDSSSPIIQRRSLSNAVTTEVVQQMLVQLNLLIDLLHVLVKSSHIQSQLQTLVQYLLQILSN